MKHDPDINVLKEQARQSFELFNHAAARSLCEQICDLDPCDAETWLMLGRIEIEAGHEIDAVRHLKTAIQFDPGLSAAFRRLADIYLKQGRLPEAAEHYNRALEIDPDQPENITALRHLSERLLETGQFSRVLQICRSLLQLIPTDAQTYSIAGTALQNQGNLMEAEHCLEQAVKLEPDNSVYSYKYACIEQALGNLDQALHYFGKSFDSGNGFQAAIAGLARTHLQLGQDEEAKKLVQSLIDIGRDDPLVLPTLAYMAPRFELTDTVIRIIMQALNRQDLVAAVRSRLYSALGGLYESALDYDSAFNSHEKSKQLIPDSYDAAAYTAYINRIIACFDRGFFQTAPRASNRSSLPVFIVGMPRSGTSLVEQILASHHDIRGAGELPDLGQAALTLSGRNSPGSRYPEYCNELTAAQLDDAANQYLSALGRQSSTALRITDKMPHNFQYLGLISILFPEARIIHISRDPMDTCLSCYFHEFSAAHAYTRTLQDLAHHYREYTRLMQNWNSLPAISILNIDYENLVTEPGPAIRKLIGFCGLDWDENCMSFHNTRRVVSTLSSEQVRKPLYRNSIGRWKNYEKHLGILKQQLAIKE